GRAALARTKSEIRNSKSETNPKHETQNPKQELWVSCFGFWVLYLFRISDFVLRIWSTLLLWHGLPTMPPRSDRRSPRLPKDRRPSVGTVAWSGDHATTPAPDQGIPTDLKGKPLSLLVVGSIAFDSIETPNGSVDDVLGGSATYFSYAASFFTRPRLVGVVGEDFPEEHRRLFISRQVDIAGLTVEPGRTFRWKGRYHQDMNTRDTLEVHLNVFGTFNPA